MSVDTRDCVRVKCRVIEWSSFYWCFGSLNNKNSSQLAASSSKETDLTNSSSYSTALVNTDHEGDVGSSACDSSVGYSVASLNSLGSTTLGSTSSSHKSKMKRGYEKLYNKVHAVKHVWNEPEIRCLRSIFTSIDTDNSGNIDCQDLRQGLLHMSMTNHKEQSADTSMNPFTVMSYIVQVLEQLSDIHGRVSRAKFQAVIAYVTISKKFSCIIDVLEIFKMFIYEHHRVVKMSDISKQKDAEMNPFSPRNMNFTSPLSKTNPMSYRRPSVVTDQSMVRTRLTSPMNKPYDMTMNDGNIDNDIHRFRKFERIFKIHSSMHEFEVSKSEFVSVDVNAKSSQSELPHYNRDKYQRSQYFTVIGLSYIEACVVNNHTYVISNNTCILTDDINRSAHNHNTNSDSNQSNNHDKMWILKNHLSIPSFWWEILERIGIVNTPENLRSMDDYDYRGNALAFEIVILNPNKSPIMSQIYKLLASIGCDIHLFHNEKEMVLHLLNHSIDFLIADLEAPIICGHEALRYAHENEIQYLLKRIPRISIHQIIHNKSSNTSQNNALDRINGRDYRETGNYHSKAEMDSFEESDDIEDVDVHVRDIYNHMTDRHDRLKIKKKPSTYIPPIPIQIKQSIDMKRLADQDCGHRSFIPTLIRGDQSHIKLKRLPPIRNTIDLDMIELSDEDAVYHAMKRHLVRYNFTHNKQPNKLGHRSLRDNDLNNLM